MQLVVCSVIIVSMYGRGFSTVPAYMRDMFGTRYVGAIRRILLTACSAVGIAGPVLINYIHEYNASRAVPKAQAYSTTMYIMIELLVVGFLANLCVKAFDKRHYRNPKWMPRLSRRVLKRRQGRPTAGSAEHGNRTNESIIAHAGFVPADIVELERGSGLTRRGIGEAETSRRSDRGCGCRER